MPKYWIMQVNCERLLFLFGFGLVSFGLASFGLVLDLGLVLGFGIGFLDLIKVFVFGFVLGERFRFRFWI
jgi:hypothetical protein